MRQQGQARSTSPACVHAILHGARPLRQHRQLHLAVAAHREDHPAVVIENRPLSLDDSVRLVTLSIEDPVKLIEGRRMAPRPAQPRWMDAYHLPGQQVVVQMGGAKLKAALASAPTEVHQRSAELDACICEVAVAQRDGAQPLFEAEPGAQAEVSDIHGIGFASPSDPQKTLMRALEDKRPLLLVASGAQGIGAARAAITWDPVLALATEQPVVLLYLTSSAQSAACMTDWDDWKQVGVTVVPVYMGGAEDSPFSDTDRLIMKLDALLSRDGEVFAAMGGKWKQASCLFAGLTGAQSKAVLSQLTQRGLMRERILMP